MAHIELEDTYSQWVYDWNALQQQVRTEFAIQAGHVIAIVNDLFQLFVTAGQGVWCRPSRTSS